MVKLNEKGDFTAVSASDKYRQNISQWADECPFRSPCQILFALGDNLSQYKLFSWEFKTD